MIIHSQNHINSNHTLCGSRSYMKTALYEKVTCSGCKDLMKKFSDKNKITVNLKIDIGDHERVMTEERLNDIIKKAVFESYFKIFKITTERTSNPHISNISIDVIMKRNSVLKSS